MRSWRYLLTFGALAAVLVASAILLWPSPSPTTATGADSITAPDTVGDVGHYTSLALDESGYPVVSYHDLSNGDLKVLHCNDPNCSGGDESISSPDTAGDVGRYNSLALDESGYPVVSYRDGTNRDLKVLHCNDPNCSGDDESITSPDTSGDLGEWTSLALDGSGNPVVSYHDLTNGDLKVLHCNDPNCGGDDESITSPDSGGSVGRFTSLELDASGNPVVSYYDVTNAGLKVLHCNDPNCSDGDESITSPDPGPNVGWWTSLELDASGNPVVSYKGGKLKVLHCNDPDCSGGGESITFVDTAGEVGWYTSLELDASGYPAVSYYDYTNHDLKVVRCNDPNCSGGDESIASPDTGGDVGYETSLELDASGYPAVSYLDSTNEDLKVLRCGSEHCSELKPTDTATATPCPTGGCPTPTVTLTPTPSPTKQPPPGDTDGDGCPDADESGPDEMLGGRRNFLNSWDYFNPTNDGQNRVDDIVAVLNRYFLSEGEPGYDVKYDRTYLGPNEWNLGPPDGQVLVDDVLHAVNSYFHDCGTGVVKPTPTPIPPNSVLDAVIQAHAALFGDPKGSITPKLKEAAQWPDTCLGLGEPGEICLTIMTPGLRVVVTGPSAESWWRTNEDGSDVRLESFR